MEADADPEPHYGRPPGSKFACRMQTLLKFADKKAYNSNLKLNAFYFSLRFLFLKLVPVL